jgi:hypothetical protein
VKGAAMGAAEVTLALDEVHGGAAVGAIHWSDEDASCIVREVETAQP